MIYGMTQTSMTPRQKRRTQRIQDILETAMAILATGGLEALTIQKLAEELDYTPGALYRYFDSKDAILLGVQRLAIESFSTVFGHARALARRVAARTAADPHRAAVLELQALYAAYRQLAIEQPVRFSLIASSMADPRQLVSDEDSAQILPPFLELLRLVVEPLQRATDANDAESLDRTIALMSSLMGVLTLHKVRRLDPHTFDVHRLTRLTFRAMLGGWGVSKETLDFAETALAQTLGEESILDQLPMPSLEEH